MIKFENPADVCSKAGLLERYLENSGNLALSVSLFFMGEDYEVPSERLVHPSVDNLIWKNAHRIISLDLRTPPSLAAWKPLIRSLPQLQSFDFRAADSDADPQGVLRLADLSHLSSVCLASFSGEAILPLDNITTLSLNSMPVETCLRLLLQCPNITSYTMSNPATSTPLAEEDRQWLSSHETPTTLAALDKLKWEFCDSIWDIHMLKYVHAPVLRWLTWREGDSIGEPNPFDPMDWAKVFCERLPPSLERLVFEEFGGDGPDIISFLQGHPGLKGISIYGDLLPESIVQVASLLDPSQTADGATPFPNLRELGISLDYDQVNLDSEDSAEFLNALLSRKMINEFLEVRFLGVSLFHPDPSIFPSEKMEALRKGDQVRLDFEYLPENEDHPQPTWYQQLVGPGIVVA